MSLFQKRAFDVCDEIDGWKANEKVLGLYFSDSNTRYSGSKGGKDTFLRILDNYTFDRLKRQRSRGQQI